MTDTTHPDPLSLALNALETLTAEEENALIGSQRRLMLYINSEGEVCLAPIH